MWWWVQCPILCMGDVMCTDALFFHTSELGDVAAGGGGDGAPSVAGLTMVTGWACTSTLMVAGAPVRMRACGKLRG